MLLVRVVSVPAVPSHDVCWMLASKRVASMNRDVNPAQSRRCWWVRKRLMLGEWCKSVGGWLAHVVNTVGAWYRTMVARGCSSPRCPIYAGDRRYKFVRFEWAKLVFLLFCADSVRCLVLKFARTISCSLFRFRERRAQTWLKWNLGSSDTVVRL